MLAIIKISRNSPIGDILLRGSLLRFSAEKGEANTMFLLSNKSRDNVRIHLNFIDLFQNKNYSEGLGEAKMLTK